jgi:hypothetical protein
MAWVDNGDAGGHALGDKMRRTTLGVADHEHVAGHGFQIEQRVRQGFALGGGRGTNVQVKHIRRQSLGRQLKGTAGAGTGFKKQVHHGPAPEQRHFLDGALPHLDKGIRRVEDVGQQGAIQAVESKEVPQLTIPGQLQVVRGRVVRGHGSPVI